jgi:hypothetical protein
MKFRKAEGHIDYDLFKRVFKTVVESSVRICTVLLLSSRHAKLPVSIPVVCILLFSGILFHVVDQSIVLQ